MDMLVKYLREETGGELSYYMDGVHVGGKGNRCAGISAGLFSKSSSISAVEDICEKFLILLISSVCMWLNFLRVAAEPDTPTEPSVFPSSTHPDIICMFYLNSCY